MEELVNPYLMTLGDFPQCMEHFALGVDYYSGLYGSGNHLSYMVLFVFEDTVDDIRLEAFGIQDEVAVFFLCTKDSDCCKHIEIAVKKIQRDNYAFVCPEGTGFMEGCENVYHDKEGIFKFLYSLAPKYLDFSKLDSPFSVRCEVRDIDRGLFFLPTRPNTFTLQHIFGNWCFPHNSKSDAEEEALKDEAVRESGTFNRQQLILKQIQQLAAIELQAAENIKDRHSLWDQVNAPLVITLPFTNADIRKQYELHNQLDAMKYKNESRTVRTVLSQGSTKNYTFNINAENNPNGHPVAYKLVVDLFFQPRSYFLDILGSLHASYRFSPYLRLPFLGKDIDRQLSFVNPKINEKLMKGTKRNSIEKVMMTVGKEMVNRTLSNEMKQHLKEYPRQIVAITDLPIEWMDIDGVPLGFSHDVCRMPESPVVGNLMHYVINEAVHFDVPRDIIKHTLVVFGTREGSFRNYQDEAVSLSKMLGFTTRTCLTIDELEKTIEEVNPQFLVVDSHGGVDMDLRQTYLMIGNEKLYPDKIAKRHITAPLVFLSACNTAPTYHTFNTVANAMVQSGAIAVTSSYMPLWVGEASELYLRILYQLSVSAEHPYHRNWLAFISHMLRTSYMHSAYKNYYRQSSKSIEEIALETGKELTKTMFFPLRRKMFYQLKSGKVLDGIKVDVSNVVPHYLMYTTIGRADLVNFQCYMEEKFS
jgi:hypothetical protein